MPYLEIKDLRKKYFQEACSAEVLKGVSINLDKGDRLVITGPSGAGKSTLLHLIGALDTPTSGEILFEGESLFSWNEKKLSRFRNEKLGFVFQFHHLLSDFTALENVMMPLLIRGMGKPSAQDQAKAALQAVGLESRFAHRPGELSGGEQQRVALARAVVGKPELILADEPTGNLDAATGRKVFDLLLELNEELKTTLLLVTHNEELIGSFPRRAHLIDGQIQK